MLLSVLLTGITEFIGVIAWIQIHNRGQLERFLFNPLLPSVSCMARLAKILILIYEGINKNNSYERRDYESVDEKSLS